VKGGLKRFCELIDFEEGWMGMMNLGGVVEMLKSVLETEF